MDRRGHCWARIQSENLFWYRNTGIVLIWCKLLAKPEPPFPDAAAAPRRGARAATITAPDAIDVRPVRRADLDQVVAIDAAVTGIEKRSYWQRIYRRYGIKVGSDQRHFLVAVAQGRVVGFMIGEVRDWEFGSPPCGWVFAIDVDPAARQRGIGTLLLAAMSAQFRRAGVRHLRTLLARENTLILSFFRSQGMMAGALIPLEMEISPNGGTKTERAR